MRNIIGIGLLGTVLLTGCVFLDDSFHKKEVSSVVLWVKDNPGLDQDYYAVGGGAGSDFRFYLPRTVVLESLVATAAYQGMGLNVDDRPLSGEGKFSDLSKSHRLSVAGADDQIVTYLVTAQYQSLAFSWFDLWDSTRYYTGQVDSNAFLEQWWNNQRMLRIPSKPTTAIQVEISDTAAPTLRPRFSHNASRVEYRGAALVAGVTPIDTTTDQVLTLVGADGTRQPVELKFTYPALTLYSVGVLAADNPSMHRDSFASINDTTKTIDLPVPTSANTGALVLQIDHTGKTLLLNGAPITSRLTAVDLTSDKTLTIQGGNGRIQDYTLHPVPVSTSSAKELTTWAAYTSKSKLVPYQPDPYYDGRSYTTTAGGVDQLTLTGFLWNTNRAAVYLALSTSGWKVTVAGKVLTQGPLSSATYNPNNFVDFTNPVQLVITAEDLSTRTITLTLVLQ